MKLNAYCVFDSKVEAYLTPFFMRADGEATRACQQAMSDPNHNFCRYPADYTLFRVGEFDDASGRLLPLDAYVNLGNLISIANLGKDSRGEVL